MSKTTATGVAAALGLGDEHGAWLEELERLGPAPRHHLPPAAEAGSAGTGGYNAGPADAQAGGSFSLSYAANAPGGGAGGEGQPGGGGCGSNAGGGGGGGGGYGSGGGAGANNGSGGWGGGGGASWANSSFITSPSYASANNSSGSSGEIELSYDIVDSGHSPSFPTGPAASAAFFDGVGGAYQFSAAGYPVASYSLQTGSLPSYTTLSSTGTLVVCPDSSGAAGSTCSGDTPTGVYSFSPKASERSRGELPVAPTVRCPARVSAHEATMPGDVAGRFRVKTHRAPG